MQERLQQGADSVVVDGEECLLGVAPTMIAAEQVLPQLVVAEQMQTGEWVTGQAALAMAIAQEAVEVHVLLHVAEAREQSMGDAPRGGFTDAAFHESHETLTHSSCHARFLSACRSVGQQPCDEKEIFRPVTPMLAWHVACVTRPRKPVVRAWQQVRPMTVLVLPVPPHRSWWYRLLQRVR
jgi:enoyl-CoA hydratase/carnithine racemase